MDKMIRELYSDMLRKTERKERLGRELQEEIAGMLKEVEKKFGQSIGNIKTTPFILHVRQRRKGL